MRHIPEHLMIEKEFITPQKLTHDSFKLGRLVFDSGFRPQFILALWRGGTPIGVIVHEFLDKKGIIAYHTAIKVEAYKGLGNPSRVIVESLSWLLKHIKRDQAVLLVDDIFDTGRSMDKVRSMVALKTDNIRIATLYYKPKNSQTDLVPDFYVGKTERWVVFPHELEGLTDQEIQQKDPFIWQLLEKSEKQG